jgi:hypothetical protein
LGNTVGAGIFVDFDASASATLSVGASGAQKNITLNSRSSNSSAEMTARHAVVGRLGYAAGGGKIRGRNLIGERYFNSKRSPKPFGFDDIVNGVKSAVQSAARNDESMVTFNQPKAAIIKKATPPKTKAKATLTAPSSTAVAAAKVVDIVSPRSAGAGSGVGGCVEMDVGLNVNVGADADFFGLFDASTTLPLFEKSFTLFKVCESMANENGTDVMVEPAEMLWRSHSSSATKWF